MGNGASIFQLLLLLKKHEPKCISHKVEPNWFQSEKSDCRVETNTHTAMLFSWAEFSLGGKKKLFPPGSLGEILQMGAVWRCEGWKQNIKIIIFWLLNVASPLLCVIFVPVQWQRADRRMNEWRLRKREWMILNSAAAASEWVSKELNWNEFFSPRAMLKLAGLAAGLEWWRKDKTQSETTWIFEVLLSCCCSFFSTPSALFLARSLSSFV